MRRLHHGGKRRLGLWLGLAALTIQVFLPFLIAAEIRVLTEDPFLFGGLDPALICSHDRDGQPTAPKPHNNTACPLCTTLAAGQATPLATAAILPVPHRSALIAQVMPAAIAPVFRHQTSYTARGPPARA
ncbi:MAG: hypothetical protein ACREFB_20960 [Stellaceae bacterium]